MIATRGWVALRKVTTAMKLKKTTKKATKPKGREKRSTHPTVSPPVSPTPPETVAAGRKPMARMPRARLTPAQKLASELTRYLRIHDAHAYGRRGQKAILDLATRAERAAQQESRPFADLFRDLSFVETTLNQVRASLEGATVMPAPTPTE